MSILSKDVLTDLTNVECHRLLLTPTKFEDSLMERSNEGAKDELVTPAYPLFARRHDVVRHTERRTCSFPYQ